MYTCWAVILWFASVASVRSDHNSHPNRSLFRAETLAAADDFISYYPRATAGGVFQKQADDGGVSAGPVAGGRDMAGAVAAGRHGVLQGRQYRRAGMPRVVGARRNAAWGPLGLLCFHSQVVHEGSDRSIDGRGSWRRGEPGDGARCRDCVTDAIDPADPNIPVRNSCRPLACSRICLKTAHHRGKVRLARCFANALRCVNRIFGRNDAF
jgi:hypothetical protein